VVSDLQDINWEKKSLQLGESVGVKKGIGHLTYSGSENGLKNGRKTMLKKLIILLICLLVTVSNVFSEDFGEYVNVVNKRLVDSCANQDNLKGWRDGLKEEFGCDLDHLESIFVLVQAERVKVLGANDKVTDEKVLLGGTVTTTGYAYKNNQKVKISQVVTIVYLMNKDAIIEDSVIIDSTKPKLFNGWIGIEI
jgi:hypothetical protein